MSATSAADYPTLGFDPTPGDTAEVAQVVRTMANVTSALNEIASVLHGAADGEWRGRAAVAFRDLLDDELRPKIDQARDGFGEAHRGLSSWSTAMAGFQGRARSLERSAAAAQAEADAARQALAALPDAPPPGAPPPDDPVAQRELDDQARRRRQQSGALESARAEVERYRALARDLADDYEVRARSVADQLAQATGIAPDEPGWFDRLKASIGDFFDGLADWAADLADHLLEVLHEIAPALQLIGDVLGLVSGILGLLAFIPGLQFLAIPALVLAGLALLAHYGAAAGESGSFLDALTDPDVLLDSVGLVLGLGSLAAGGRLLAATSRVGGAQNFALVPQLLGPPLRVPHGFFKIARGVVTSMEFDELVVRSVALHVTWAGFGATGAGLPSNASTIKKIFRWDFGPMRNEPVVT